MNRLAGQYQAKYSHWHKEAVNVKVTVSQSVTGISARSTTMSDYNL